VALGPSGPGALDRFGELLDLGHAMPGFGTGASPE
jgi:hypothetical protein